MARLSRQGWGALAALLVAVTSAGAQTSTAPVVRVLLNQTTFQPGSTLQLGADVANPGGGPSADFYLGIQLPDGVNTVTVRLGAAPAAATLANLASLAPTASGIDLAGAFAVREPALLTYTFSGVEPLGTYTAYLAAVVAGGLRDGALGPGELLAFTTTSFTFGAGGILLSGAPTDAALGVTADYASSTGVDDTHVSLDGAGREIARTQLEILFQPAATVGQVNAVLTAIDGRIVSMVRGVLIMLVEIPDPGSLAGLDAIVTRARALPGVRDVIRQTFMAATTLPSNHTPTSSNLDKIDHLLAIRQPAAVNSVAVLDQAPTGARPTIVVADNFGGGAPGAPFDVLDVPGDFTTGRPDRHGYHVLGIITATQGGSTSDTGLATGLLPGRSTVRIVDQRRRAAVGDVQNRLIVLLRQLSGNAVVNTSLGFVCETAAQAAVTCTAANAAAEAARWLEKVRGTADRAVAGAGLERRFVHATSAGNTDASGRDSSTSSAFAAAALRTDIGLSDGVILPPATNTLVVEDHVTVPGTVVSRGCLSPGSKRVFSRSFTTNAVNVSAVGTDVWSLTNASTTAGNASGTSMASPQAAALAAWVWTLRPSLTPAQVRAIVTETAVDAVGCGSDDPAPSLDVYGAVLGTDLGTFDAPVRRSLLDVAAPGGPSTPDGVFGDDDLTRFAQAFAAGSGTPTFSRFDLNGDGFTGAGQLTLFDLDFDRRLQTASYIAGGSSVTVNERQASDIEILCYYAFSPLFAGTPAGRTAAIGPACGETPGPFRFPHGRQQMRVSASAFAGAVTDSDATTSPNVALRDLTASSGADSATVSNVQNTVNTIRDVATAIEKAGTFSAQLSGAGGGSAVAELRYQYDIDVPAGSSGTATFTAAFVGDTGTFTVTGPNLNDDRRFATGGTVTIPLQGGGRYTFFAGFIPLARNTSKTASLTFSLTATVTP